MSNDRVWKNKCYIYVTSILTLAKWYVRIKKRIFRGETMDKNEFRLKIEQMMHFMKGKSYKEAYEVAESINWKKVKNVGILCAASEVYEACGEFQKGRDILFLAYDISPDSKKVIYRLGILALKQGELKEAMDCYEEFMLVAPKDSNRFILKYKILKAKKAPLEEQIAVLEEFKAVEYVEKWAFELAILYQEAGMITECLEECDDLILWFNEGTYIYKAMELKMKYKPLTPLQHEKYMSRFKETVEKQPEIEEKEEEVQEEVQEEVKEEVQEEVVEVQEEPVEEPEEPIEELAEELVEEPVEEVVETTSEEVEEEENPVANIEKMVQAWEEEQKENAQMIQAKLEQVEQEKAQLEENVEVEEEVEDILPNDIRTLMEELEAESAEISAQKTAVEEEEIEEKPLFQKVVEQLTALDKKLDKTEKEEVVIEEQEPIEEIDDPEDEGIKLGDTQSIALSTKALQNATRVEFPIEEFTPTKEEPVKKQASPYDTGFIVQGRYDMEVQSEVGVKAGLTEEQTKLFSYFVPVRGMSEQLVKVLDDDKNCKTRYGTSKVGNIAIAGRKGSGKTVLAVDLIKAIQKARKIKHGKVAIVKAESLNKKDAREILVKLHGGALVIEKASRLQRNTVEVLSSAMEGQTGELLVVIEDERKALEKLFAEHPNFKQKFTSRIDLPVFLNDELVRFGQTYAKENGYKIDDMGILALYSDIDVLQREEKVVTVADVKDLIDDAIENSKRPTAKKLINKVFGKNKDESERIILKEEDFR